MLFPVAHGIGSKYDSFDTKINRKRYMSKNVYVDSLDEKASALIGALCAFLAEYRKAELTSRRRAFSIIRGGSKLDIRIDADLNARESAGGRGNDGGDTG